MNDDEEHAPRRRIMLYVPDTDRDSLEVVILGRLHDIADIFAATKSAAERWRGFGRVRIIGSGSTCGVLRMTITEHARCNDPIVEFATMWASAALSIHAHERGFEWHATADSSGVLLGTW